jgi:uncharacterized protein (TIGR02186 family)
MKRILILLLAGCLVCLWGAQALAVAPEAQHKVITSASKNLVEIGLTYHGDQIFFFGVNPVPGADIVIKLTAEKEEVLKLSMKGRVGPFWMTVKQYEITGAPFIYKIHASKPLNQIISKETALSLGLGYDAVRPLMKMHLIRGEAAPDDADVIWNGLVKIKERGNLFNIVEDSKRLDVSEGTLFKHYFKFPPAATEGRYLVESFCFKDGHLVAYGKDVIEIKKVGLANWLTQASKNSAILYGIMAVIIALVAGLLVGVIFGKGGHH